jgi:predicted nucleotidyltransferase
MANRNLELLKVAAKLLRPVLDELVFVGGCATGLLVSDEAAAEVRPTFDVDAIAEITSYVEYTTFGERLHKLGFTEDASEGAPICRWQHGQIKLDLMPLDEKILGFSNRWYKAAMDTANEFEIERDIRIRVVTAPYFCATKLEAFKGRGKGDYLASHDLEDLITVVDGRPELLDELRSAPEDVRSYIADAVGQMLKARQFIDALAGYLLPDSASQARINQLLAKLTQISEL